ncbi:hypothetical protein ACB092_07G167500 [Castanea dentata]
METDQGQLNSVLDEKIYQIYKDLLTRVTKFEELVAVGGRLLAGFQEGLEYLRRPPIDRASKLVENIIKANETKRVKSYFEASCINTHDGVHSISKWRLKKLNPKDKDGVLSLSWMKLAMVSLCETHNDIKTLITELELPVCDWDEKWIDAYLDISVNLLDICNAFSSEISRLNQGHLLLQCVLHNLDSSSSKQFIKAQSSLDAWRQHISSKNPKLRLSTPQTEIEILAEGIFWIDLVLFYWSAFTYCWLVGN